jgi:hypothetical protein
MGWAIWCLGYNLKVWVFKSLLVIQNETYMQQAKIQAQNIKWKHNTQTSCQLGMMH